MAMKIGTAVLIALLLVGCGENPENSTDASKPLHATIRDAGWYPPVLNQEIDFGEARSGEVITATGEEILALSKRMNEGYQPVVGALESINFTVLGGAGKDPTVGRKIAHMSYKVSEMRRLAKSGATGKQMLDAAKEVGTWTPANDDVVNAYCQADTPFCQSAR